MFGWIIPLLSIASYKIYDNIFLALFAEKYVYFSKKKSYFGDLSDLLIIFHAYHWFYFIEMIHLSNHVTTFRLIFFKQKGKI